MADEITKADALKMKALAKEGKRISVIRKDYFPKLSYFDVYLTVYGSGGRSAMGVKRMITTRLAALASAKKAKRAELAEELQELVMHLYKNHKSNHEKLTQIRQALAE
jgi:hypothetical protein